MLLYLALPSAIFHFFRLKKQDDGRDESQLQKKELGITCNLDSGMQSRVEGNRGLGQGW